MQHFFDCDIATEYGLVDAILLNYVNYWVEYNQANETNYHDGYFWTYNSIKAFKELFPYLSEKKIRGALDRLENKGLILIGEYNEMGYDRTKWYTLSQKGKCICTKGQMDIAKRANGYSQKGEPIPINIPINKNINNNICSEQQNYSDQENKKNIVDLILNDKSYHHVTEDDYQLYVECFPNVDVKSELLKMKSWCESNQRKRKTKRGISSFINNWLSKAQDKGYRNYQHNDYQSNNCDETQEKSKWQ